MHRCIGDVEANAPIIRHIGPPTMRSAEVVNGKFSRLQHCADYPLRVGTWTCLQRGDNLSSGEKVVLLKFDISTDLREVARAPGASPYTSP